MKGQTRDIMWALAIALTMCAIILVWWFNSPMYREVRAYNEMAARAFLAQSYYFGDYGPVGIDKPERLLVDVDPSVEIENPIMIAPVDNPVYSGVGVACFLGSVGMILIYDFLRKRRGKADDE